MRKYLLSCFLIACVFYSGMQYGKYTAYKEINSMLDGIIVNLQKMDSDLKALDRAVVVGNG